MRLGQLSMPWAQAPGLKHCQGAPMLRHNRDFALL
jgi:hypothetical protein